MSLSTILAFSSAGDCAPAKKKKPPLEAIVRAQMPKGFLSVATFQMAPAPKEKPYLLHVWTTPRRDPEGGPTDPAGNRAPSPTGPVTVDEVKGGGMLPSPYVLDVFVPGDKAGQWNYRTSIAWAGTQAPGRYSLRFLDAKKKEGLVISMTYVTAGFKYDSSSEEIYTLPQAWDGPVHGPRSMSSSEDNISASVTGLVRNANGLLQIKEEVRSNQFPDSFIRLYNWNPANSQWELAAAPAKPASP